MPFKRLVPAVFLSAALAQAGVLIKQTIKDLDSGGVITSEVLVDTSRIKAENAGGSQNSLFLYLGDEGRFYIVNTADGTYRTFSRQQLERMFNQASQMSAMVEEKLAGLSPRQRAMVEQMMKRGPAPARAPAVEKTVYRKVGSETVGRWSCDKYEGTRGSEKVEEVWTASLSAVDLRSSDFQVFRDLASLLEGFANRMNVDLYRIGSETPADGEYNGVPVRRITYRNGRPYQQYDVTEVTRQDFDDDAFRLSPDLREIESPMSDLAPQRRD